MSILKNLIIYLPALIFCVGLFGIIFSKKNIIIVIMSIELLLLAINIFFIIFGICWGDIFGQIIALIVLTVAAAESAIGLAILVIYNRLQGSILLETIINIKG
jgi:NADH-quinone oxidoreductase subunit K